MLYSEEAVPTVLDKLRPDDFFDRAHRFVMEAIVELSTHGRPCDLVSVRTFLEDSGRIDHVGGSLYLNKIIDSVVTSASLEHYIEIVKNKSLLRTLVRVGARIQELGQVTDVPVGDLLDEAVSLVNEPNSKLSGGRLLSIGESAEAYMDLHGKSSMGLSSGFASLDYEIFDMAGQVCVIAGLPNMGKTVFALNMLHRLARRNIPVGVISLEMANTTVTERFAQMNAHIDRRTMWNDSEKRSKALMGVAAMPIVYANLYQSKLSNVLRTMRMMVHEHDVKMILVDYIQLVQGNVSDRYDLAVGSVVRAFLEFAQEYNVSVVSPSQVGRASLKNEVVVKGEPRLWQMKDSAEIEAHADVVLGVFRPSYTDGNEIPSVEDFYVRILKQRAGLVGKRLKFSFYPLEQRLEESVAEEDIF